MLTWIKNFFLKNSQKSQSGNGLVTPEIVKPSPTVESKESPQPIPSSPESKAPAAPTKRTKRAVTGTSTKKATVDKP